MKRFTKILAIWGCVVTIPMIYLLVVYLDREGIVEFQKEAGVDYYYPKDLHSKHLPNWDLTNTIPLSPDAAVRAALHYSTEIHPDILSWDVDRISLDNENDGIWTYDIELIDRHSGRYVPSNVKILMDGSIWKPTKEERQR